VGHTNLPRPAHGPSRAGPPRPRKVIGGTKALPSIKRVRFVAGLRRGERTRTRKVTLQRPPVISALRTTRFPVIAQGWG
jgi:hypothetical protein